MRLRRVSLALVAQGLVGCALDLSTTSTATSAHTVTRRVITEAEVTRQAENTEPTGPWVIYTRNAGAGAFQRGPETPPSGHGSLGLTTPASGDKVFLFNYGYTGTHLASFTQLGYATFRTAGAVPNQVTSINLQVDVNGLGVEGGFTTLVFEPVYNRDQGAVIEGEWQTWDALADGAAVWWSTRAIPGVCAVDCFVRWSDIVAANPDAVIVGGVGVNQGSGNPGLTCAVDRFVVGVGGAETTYDFEAFRTPSSHRECRDGGWQTLRRDDGTAFRNQGDCVVYAKTGR